MFDQLLDSNLKARNVRSRLFFAIAAAVYAVVLLAITATAILLFNPGLAAAMPLEVRLTTLKFERPMDATTQRRTTSIRTGAPASRAFVVPKPATSESRPRPDNLPEFLASGPRDIAVGTGSPSGLPPGIWTGGPGVPGHGSSTAPAPPPVERPKPSSVERKTDARVSEGVLQGGAISKEVPRYPDIAKRAGIQGPVQVLVTIDETGRVIEATVVNGNPLLRQAALDAAWRWKFSPTMLSRVAVRVQGILTFNFQLNRQ